MPSVHAPSITILVVPGDSGGGGGFGGLGGGLGGLGGLGGGGLGEAGQTRSYAQLSLPPSPPDRLGEPPIVWPGLPKIFILPPPPEVSDDPVTCALLPTASPIAIAEVPDPVSLIIRTAHLEPDELLEPKTPKSIKILLVVSLGVIETLSPVISTNDASAVVNVLVFVVDAT